MQLGQPDEAFNIYNRFVKRRQKIASLDRYDRRINYEFGRFARRGRPH